MILHYIKCISKGRRSFSHLASSTGSKVPVAAVLSVVDLGACQSTYDTLQYSFTLTDSQICAGSESGDSCGVSGLSL